MSNTEDVEVPIIRPNWLNITEQPVNQIFASTDLDLAIGCLADGQIRLVSLSLGETLHTWQAHRMGTVAAALSTNQKYLATSGEDNKICVWNLENHEKIFEWKSRAWIDQILWNHDDIYFSSDKKLFTCKLTNTEIKEIDSWSHSLSALTVKSQNELGAAGYSRLSIYDLDSHKEIKRFNWKGQLDSLVFSPNNRYAVCSSNDLSIHIWDLKKDKDLSMRGFHSKIRDLSFRSDGLYMANCSGREFIVWDYMDPGPANKRPQVFGPYEKDINAIKYQNNGKMLASFGDDGVILFWRPDLFDDRPLAIAGIRDQSISSAVWTPNDQHVLTGLQTGYMALYPVPEVKES